MAGRKLSLSLRVANEIDSILSLPFSSDTIVAIDGKELPVHMCEVSMAKITCIEQLYVVM